MQCLKQSLKERFVLRLKLLFLLFIVLSGVSGCLFWEKEESGGPSVQLHLENQDSLYLGIPMKFWVDFSAREIDSTEVFWQTGHSSIFRRSWSGEEEAGSDTMYLEWKSSPPLTVIQDSATSTTKRLDTIRVFVKGVASQEFVVEVLNIFPTLDSMAMLQGFPPIVRNDSIWLRTHLGGQVQLSATFSDPLYETPVEILWPEFMWVGGKSPRPNLSGESEVYYFDAAPQEVVDRFGTLIVKDGAGAERNWNLRYQTYQEQGSLWVGSHWAATKISGTGLELYRESWDYHERVQMAFNEQGTSLFLVSADGKTLSKKSSLTFVDVSGFGITIDKGIQSFVVGNRSLWVSAGATQAGVGTQITKYSSISGEAEGPVVDSIQGNVLSMSMDRRDDGGFWYVNDRVNTLHRVQGDTLALSVDTVIVDPTLVSYDSDNEVCWVSNGKVVVAVNGNGQEISEISGFGNVVSLSSDLGFVWVVDRLGQQVYRLNSALTTDRTITQLGTGEVSVSLQDPVFATAVRDQNQGVWVVEQGKGSVVRIGNDGTEMFRFTGLNIPISAAIVQEL